MLTQDVFHWGKHMSHEFEQQERETKKEKTEEEEEEEALWQLKGPLSEK